MATPPKTTGSKGKIASEWRGSTYIGPQKQATPAADAAGDWFQQHGILVPDGQQTASLGAPRALEGYDQAKLSDPTAQSNKYVAGRIMQSGGSVDQVLADPKFAGWTKTSGDKIMSPEGSVYDLSRDATGSNGQPGANAAQYTYVGGGPAGTRNNGIKGDDPNSANYTKPGGLGYKGTAPAPAGTAGAMASMSGQMVNSQAGGGNTSGMQMPTAPPVNNITAPAPFSYEGIGNLGNTPQMQQQSYNPAATPTPLSYENLATPEGYTPEAYQGMTAEQLQSDPSYQFRLKAGQDALENTLARTGSLRGGNAANALMAQGQGMASQEYAAADARARATNQMNNQTSLGAYQTNAQTGLAYNQNANQNALNFGNANYNQAFQTNQANNQGSNAAIAANNQSALAQNAQGLAAQQQGYNQAAGTYGMNAGNTLAYGQANNQNALANYNAQANNALGLGNLNLGYTQAANQYSLGQGNLALGQGQLAQQGNQQAFNQANQTWQNNYRANVTDPWAQQYGLASLGQPVRPD